MNRAAAAAILATVLCAAVMILFALAVNSAWPAWQNVAQEWEPYNLTPSQRSWFKDQRTKWGTPCCDISDGHRTDFDIRGNDYWIPNPASQTGEWMKVPPETVIHNSGNPIGEAVVWYANPGGPEVYIRCFVPGGGV